MPQMMPLMWYSYFMVIAVLIIFTSINSFQTSKKTMSSNSINKKFNWKW